MLRKAAYTTCQRERAAEAGFETAQCGAVTFEQPFGSFLNANLHFHSLIADGVWVEDGTGSAVFHPTAAPTTAEVQQVVDRVRQRVERLVVRRGVRGLGQPGRHPIPRSRATRPSAA